MEHDLSFGVNQADMDNYDITGHVGVSFNVNNVTNKKYIHSLYWEQSYYGAPRNYAISVNWQL